MNKSMILGRLTRNPDVRYSDNPEGQLAIARFTVAVNRPAPKGEKEKADFISCVAFGRTAQLLEKYFSKGSRILVEGRIQTGSYKNRDGQTVYTTDLYAERIEFVDYKNDSRQSPPEGRNRQQEQGNGQTGQQNTRQSQPPAPPETYYQYGWADEMTDEGLPFN